MDKYRQERVKRLQKYVSEQGLDAMLVTSQDAIYYLSGASYTPVERPFFIIVKPQGAPSLVVPRLEYEHMMKVEGFGEIHYYFEYPSIPGQNWYDYIAQDVGEKCNDDGKNGNPGGRDRISEGLSCSTCVFV